MSEINISTSIKDIIAVSNVTKGNKAVKNSNSSKFQDFLGEASDSKSGDKVDLYSNDLGSSSSDKDDNTVEKSDEHNNLKDISSKKQLLGKIGQNIQELLALMCQQSKAVNIQKESITDSNSSVINEFVDSIKQVDTIAAGENKFSLNDINSKISLIISDIKGISDGTKNVDLENIQDNKNNSVLSNEEISTLKSILSELENLNGNDNTSVNESLSGNDLLGNDNIINASNNIKNIDFGNQSISQTIANLKSLELINTSDILQQNHINQIEIDETLGDEKFIGHMVNELKKVISFGTHSETSLAANKNNFLSDKLNLKNSSKVFGIQNSSEEDKNNSLLNAKEISTLKSILSELENLNGNDKTSVNESLSGNDLLGNDNIINAGNNIKNIDGENQSISQTTANLKSLELINTSDIFQQNHINQIEIGETLGDEKFIGRIVNELKKVISFGAHSEGSLAANKNNFLSDKLNLKNSSKVLAIQNSSEEDKNNSLLNAKEISTLKSILSELENLNGNDKTSVNESLSGNDLLGNDNIINAGNNIKNIDGENQSISQTTTNLKSLELINTSGILQQNHINQIKTDGTSDSTKNGILENPQENKNSSLLDAKEISTLKNILSELENLNENNKTSVNKSLSADNLSQNKDNDFLRQLINNDNSDNQYSKVINIMNQFTLNNANGSRQNEDIQPTVINKTNFTSDIIKSLSYMEDNNVKDMTVKIMPKELGEVMIKITSDSGIMKATITATNKDAYNLLNSNLHEISNSLNNNHIKIHSLDINIYNNDTTYFSNNSNFSQFDGRQNENTNNQSSNLNLNNNLNESQDKLENEIAENNNVNVLV
ncbi:MAG: flagellar hook-length control protein FliK [Clostridium sp.]|uniref:flagellar hook-length control protein FliK n=1 Tax=Clostridium sp. TaxID=1506 RepID=UPI0039E8A24B